MIGVSGELKCLLIFLIKSPAFFFLGMHEFNLDNGDVH